ncbi:MAG: TetR/AcrR family transcriptional regulator [Syntrophales bacterium]
MGLEERRKRERENRRNAILKAARKLFFEKGFRIVTVDSIAKRAELSKGSIYLYFNSKEEIYTHILLNDIDKFHKNLTQLFKNDRPAGEALIDLASIYVDFFLSDRELFRILMTFMLHTNHMNLPEDLNENIIKTTNKTINIIEQIFQYGIERGEFPATINLRKNRNAIWGLLNGIISLHLFTGKESRREERIRATVRSALTIYIEGLKITVTGKESSGSAIQTFYRGRF